MLLSASLKLAAIAASLLAAAPLANADLRQGPTGVEYVKRFAASPASPTGLCTYSCPPTYQAPNGLNIAVQDPAGNAGSIPDGRATTTCVYVDPATRPNAIQANCAYTDDGNLYAAGSYFYVPIDSNDLSAGGSMSGNTNCPLTAAANCDPRKRNLSPLEKLVKSRQYNPRRRAAKQQ